MGRFDKIDDWHVSCNKSELWTVGLYWDNYNYVLMSVTQSI